MIPGYVKFEKMLIYLHLLMLMIIIRELASFPLEFLLHRILCPYLVDEICVKYGSLPFLLSLSLCGKEKPIGFQIRYG